MARGAVKIPEAGKGDELILAKLEISGSWDRQIEIFSQIYFPGTFFFVQYTQLEAGLEGGSVRF